MPHITTTILLLYLQQYHQFKDQHQMDTKQQKQK